LEALAGAATSAYAVGVSVFGFRSDSSWKELEKPAALTATLTGLSVFEGGAVAVGKGAIALIQGERVSLVPPPPVPTPANVEWSGVVATSASHFWVCAKTTGLGLFEFSNGQWVSPPAAFAPRGLTNPVTACTTLLRTQSGDLWAGMNEGALYRFPADGGIELVESGTANDLTALAEYRGRLMIAAEDGALTSVPLP
jgi:hypothetical protein